MQSHVQKNCSLTVPCFVKTTGVFLNFGHRSGPSGAAFSLRVLARRFLRPACSRCIVMPPTRWQNLVPNNLVIFDGLGYIEHDRTVNSMVYGI